jgi:uncharacterized protein with FMN-binding domain
MRMNFIVLLSAVLIAGRCGLTAIADDTGSNIHNKVERIKNFQISDISPATVAEGEYTAKVPFGKYVYRVKVTVKSGKMTDIVVLDNGTGNEYARRGLKVIERILEKQTPAVDAITGATVTSKALMKCVEKALNEGR